MEDSTNSWLESWISHFQGFWKRLNERLNLREVQDTKEHSPLPREAKAELAPASSTEYGLNTFILDDSTDEEVKRIQLLFSEVRAQLEREAALEKVSSKPKSQRNSSSSLPKKEMPPLSERVKAVKDLFESISSKPKSTMICFIMYDITDNKIRKRIADYLEEKGCYRVQKSIFLGQLDRKLYREIQNALWELQKTYENQDSILFVPVSEDEIKAMRIIGKEINVPFMLQRGNSVFF